MNRIIISIFVFIINCAPFAAHAALVDANGTIVDTAKNLIWLKNSNCFGAQTLNNSTSSSSALADGQCGLADGSIAGDWRLPTIAELQTLPSRASLTAAGFQNVQDVYGSSSVYPLNTGNYWHLDLSITPSISYYNFMTTPTGVLPVRSGQLQTFAIAPRVFTYPVTNTDTLRTSTFRLNNGGAETISVTAIAIVGTDSNQFTVAPGGVAPCASLTPTLNTGDSCTLNVIFAPTSTGSKNAELQINSDSVTNSTLSAALSGTAPQFIISSSTPGSVGGTITCTSPVSRGVSSTCTITPTVAGYALLALTDNSIDVKGQVSGTKYTISNVTANHTVLAMFSDISPPNIHPFIVPATSSSLTVALAFLVTDNAAVSAYCLTETNSTSGCSWNTTKPTSYTFSTTGTKSLFAFAKDATGNISTGASATILVDTVLPAITSFNMPPTSTSITVPISTFTATDNEGVTGCCLSESNVSTGCTWTSGIPTSYTFATSGNKILYAWVKDAVGNISSSVSTTTSIETAPPAIASFSIPATSTSLTVPIITFNASDNVGVTGYCVKLVNTAVGCAWITTAPTSYTFALATTNGSKTLYAWAKDAAENISTIVSAVVTLDLAVPTVTAFSVVSNVNSLTVPISNFTATDSYGGVNGYIVTESSAPPLPSDSRWNATAPASYTFSSFGGKTLYAWVKDAAGNVSVPATASSDLCAITASSDANGAISLSGESIYCRQNRIYKMAAKPGYKVTDVIVDGVPVGAVNHYLFTAVTGSHTIAASFAPDGNANWSGISAGNNHSAAIRSDGTLWSWGTNDVGQVGDGSQTNRTNPVQVGNKTIWDRVSTGNRYTLGHRTDGTLWSWGYNNYGQLGDGTIIGKIIPQQVGLLTTWSNVAAGGLTDNYPIGAVNPAFPGHSAALKSDGSLQSWGYNLFGEVGNSSSVNATSPVTTGIAGIQYVDISAGANHTVALRADGTLWAWGRNNWGQLGVASQIDKTAPVQIGTVADWIAISAGYEHTLAIKNDGSLWGWGHNDQGQLGVETPAFSTTPILIDNSAIYSAIATGGYHSLAVKNDGTLWTFGRNLEGQLGDGTGATKSYPVQVGFDSDWASVEAGEYHTLALKSNGTMWSWGGNAGGQLGDTTTADRLSPVMIGTNTNNFLIRSSGTAGGNITPLGNVSVAAGTSKAYAIAALVGYQISDVKIDGVSQGAITGYTFTNTTGNHTIEAIFTSIATTTYTVTALAGTGGSITPPGTITVNSGTSQSFTISPLGGYITSDVVVDGASQGAITGYPFSNITANHTISATFAIIADSTLPTISAFSIPASSNSLNVSVNLTATDNSGTISTYCLTETNSSAACIWTALKPTTYSFGTTGSKTLYAFVKDPTGNISASSSAATAITLADGTAPIVSAFSIPATSGSLTVAITILTASDNVAVAGYLLTESITTPLLNDSGWNSIKPTSFTFNGITQGVATAKTLYAWAKDAAGNISASLSAPVTITLSDVTAPTVTTFTLPATSSTLLVPVSTLDATDNVAVTAWLLTETSLSPSASATGWSSTKPTSYTFTSAGAKTLYAWAKDGAGNVSASLMNATVTVDTAGPTLTLSTLADGAVTNNATLNVAGTVTDISGVLGLTVNNAAATITNGSFSYPVTLQAGANVLTVTAADIVGNISTETRTITLDQSAPNLTVSAPADNSKTAQTLASVSGTINETSTVTVKVNSGSLQNASINGTVYSATVNLGSGLNTITITATDLAGNPSSIVRTVTYDDTIPSLAITDPNQDITTAQNNITLSGTVSDSITSATVSISFNGQALTPPVTSGTFSQLLTFPSEATWPVVVTAADEVGNLATATRNIIYAIPANGSCGTSNNATLTATPASYLCNSGTASAVTGTGPWGWMCSGSNGGTTASCSASIQTYSVTFAAGTGGSLVGTTSQTLNYGASATAVSATPISGYHFVNWTGTGGFVATTSNPLTVATVTVAQTMTANFAADAVAVNGVCGANSGGIFTVMPSANLCSAGTASIVTGTGPWGWSCNGINGGITASCTAGIQTYAVTFAAGTGGSLVGTTSQTLNYGASATAVSATPISGYHFVNWTGTGGFVATTSNPLTVATVTAAQAMTANFAADAVAVNGVCGTGNGSIFTVIPTTNLCLSGIASTVFGTNPWNWTCGGLNGGITGNCATSAATSPTPQFTVTPHIGAGFAIAPVSSQTVNINDAISFTVTPASGYGILSVSGCGGSFNGSTYTTGAITANCSINVTAIARNATSGVTTLPTLNDALKTLRAVVGMGTLTPEERIRYDVAPLSTSAIPVGNGVLDAADVIMILRRSIGIGSW